MPDLKVEVRVTHVPLPDEEARERWYESWRLLMELGRRLDMREAHDAVAVETTQAEAPSLRSACSQPA